MQNQELYQLKQLIDPLLNHKILQIQHLRELRRILTITPYQNLITQQLKEYIPILFKQMHKQLSNQRKDKLQSFFLQFLANCITANINNSRIVYNIMLQGFRCNREEYHKLLNIIWQNNCNRKFIYIFFYNIFMQLKKQISWTDFILSPFVKYILSLFLSDFGETQHDQLFQWKIINMVQIFNYSNIQTSTLKFLFQISSSQYHLHILQFIFHLFVEIIQKKCTPTLITDCSPVSQSLIQSYNKNYDYVIRFSKFDIEFIIKCWDQHFNNMKISIIQYCDHKNVDAQAKLTLKKNIQDGYKIMNQILLIVCEITFLGGHNPKVQILLKPLLIPVGSYFQLIYLLYKIYQTQNQLKESNFIKKQNFREDLLKLLNFTSYESITNFLQLYQQFQLKETIPIILRIFANLVHINPQLQVFFEEQMKYTYMCMSLTHIDTQLQTMRQWALIIIRNLSEFSEIIRKKIQDLKIDLRVTSSEFMQKNIDI